MNSLSQVEGTFVDVDGHYVIVVGRFNHHVVDSLVEGAVDSLTRHGVDKAGAGFGGVFFDVGGVHVRSLKVSCKKRWP